MHTGHARHLLSQRGADALLVAAEEPAYPQAQQRLAAAEGRIRRPHPGVKPNHQALMHHLTVMACLDPTAPYGVLVAVLAAPDGDALDAPR